MTHGSLFSGIGGFDLAAEWMSWENVFHCEWNKFGKRVLNYYWPNAISYHDITKTDFTIHRGSIDILTGEFPCQPYSMAGKRKGKNDDRHLWPEMLRAIREIQPRWIVGENVFGLINWNGGMVFDEVQADLEAAGYEVWPYVFPACAVNAPHRRDRIWFVAYGHSNRQHWSDSEHEIEPIKRGEYALNDIEPVCDVANTDRSDRGPAKGGRIKENKGIGAELQQSAARFSDIGVTSDTTNIRHESFRDTRKRRAGFTNNNSNGDNANTDCTRREKQHIADLPNESEYNSTYDFKKPGDWSNFPTQSPVCIGNDGLPSKLDRITFPKWRNESIKAGGNAIVPQVVYQIFKAIKQYESNI